jgi:hypothetical protein
MFPVLGPMRLFASLLIGLAFPLTAFGLDNFGVPLNVQGLWWASPPGSESGWGVNIAQQGDTFMAAWFTYDETGNATWYVMPDGLEKGHSEFLGPLYRVSGPSFTGAFDPSKVSATQVGDLDIAFADSSHARFDATVNGALVTKFIVPQIFASPPLTCVTGGTPGSQPNYTDLWWKSPAGSESGWGLFLTHQGDVIFAVWFTYDTDGKPVWFVGSNVAKTGNATYSGPLYRTFGPPFSASPWDPSRVSAMPVGSATLTFTDGSNGTFAHTVEGFGRTDAITREVFASPPTVCN